MGSGVATCPDAFLNPAVRKEVAIRLNGLPCGFVASLRCLAIIVHHVCLPYVLGIPREVERLIVASGDYLSHMKDPSAQMVLSTRNPSSMIHEVR